MLICTRCGKGKNIQAFSRHKKGSSGAGGVWALRAPIHSRVQKVNLHIYNGKKYCTKCLRIIKTPYFPQKPSISTPII
ncbi:MAG: hypothetical protein Q8P92_05250 [Candidatus Daviesbacteria bacterium]|nr:hypothetical protein [Candidatus Daviesbacteria bacterium]